MAHYHLLYKTTNNANGMIYIGVHSTQNLEDSYLGSGDFLLEDIKKYGRDSFVRETILRCKSREDAFKYEAYIVDREFLKREDTYNAVEGGSCPLSLAQEYRIEVGKLAKHSNNLKELISLKQ